MDLDADNASDKSTRDFLRQFNEIEKEQKGRLFAYSIMTISNDLGQVRYGTYELNLFRPPVNFHKRGRKDLIKDKVLKITIQMPEHKEFEDMKEEEQLKIKQELEKKKKERERVVPYVDCTLTEVDRKMFYQTGDGIDFYID